ncbi:MAG: [FeFe] hydrogenase H-cluster maturation GTPase HydF, partial [Victivallaceae bacterium]|nr:[FeFe] hydrogenase H-cluster maturation GTPase HydF [Victivallaceae bacterium]
AEQYIANEAKRRKVPLIIIINKCDLKAPSPEFKTMVAAESSGMVIETVASDHNLRDQFLNEYKQALIQCCPDDFLKPPPLIGDLIKPGETVIMLVPIDLQAPKGRIILPQVQVLRDGLDNSNIVITVKETEYQTALKNLKNAPALTVCDSQVVDLMVRETPPEIVCTTFSILFARLKGNMELMAAGAAAIGKLKKNGGRVLIAEACTHHATEDDIGRVKIPRLLRRFTGREDLTVDVYAGTDYPADLSGYDLVVHCGGCMFNRRAILSRIQLAASSGVAITNYGMCISFCHGVLDRVLSPFPDALAAYHNACR